MLPSLQGFLCHFIPWPLFWGSFLPCRFNYGITGLAIYLVVAKKKTNKQVECSSELAINGVQREQPAPAHAAPRFYVCSGMRYIEGRGKSGKQTWRLCPFLVWYRPWNCISPGISLNNCIFVDELITVLPVNWLFTQLQETRTLDGYTLRKKCILFAAAEKRINWSAFLRLFFLFSFPLFSAAGGLLINLSAADSNNVVNLVVNAVNFFWGGVTEVTSLYQTWRFLGLGQTMNIYIKQK